MQRFAVKPKGCFGIGRNDDEAHTLDLHDADLLARTSCRGSPSQHRVAPAGLLPPPRSPSLRHVCGDGGKVCVGNNWLYSFVVCSIALPFLPRLNGGVHHASLRADWLRCGPAWFASPAPLARGRPLRSPPKPSPHPRRPRPSCISPRLRVPLKSSS